MLSNLDPQQLRQVHELNLMYLECVRFLCLFAEGLKASALDQDMSDRINALASEKLSRVAHCGHPLLGLRLTQPSQLRTLLSNTTRLDSGLSSHAYDKLCATNMAYLSAVRDLGVTRQGVVMFALAPPLQEAIEQLSTVEIRHIARRGLMLPILRIRLARHLDALIDGGQNAQAYSHLAGLSNSIIPTSALVVQL
jgi:hypothetical protein